jgi:hypothetical protein
MYKATRARGSIDDLGQFHERTFSFRQLFTGLSPKYGDGAVINLANEEEQHEARNYAHLLLLLRR